ncbi:hypothetical protein, partial [Desulfopila aestuarii]|uniref:hypothetical protein n=1 Tax=Desulfopila aestuarii TaxID=231440 RepID=UPI001F4187FC
FLLEFCFGKLIPTGYVISFLILPQTPLLSITLLKLADTFPACTTCVEAGGFEPHDSVVI